MITYKAIVITPPVAVHVARRAVDISVQGIVGPEQQEVGIRSPSSESGVHMYMRRRMA